MRADVKKISAWTAFVPTPRINLRAYGIFNRTGFAAVAHHFSATGRVVAVPPQRAGKTGFRRARNRRPRPARQGIGAKRILFVRHRHRLAATARLTRGGVPRRPKRFVSRSSLRHREGRVPQSRASRPWSFGCDQYTRPGGPGATETKRRISPLASGEPPWGRGKLTGSAASVNVSFGNSKVSDCICLSLIARAAGSSQFFSIFATTLCQAAASLARSSRVAWCSTISVFPGDSGSSGNDKGRSSNTRFACWASPRASANRAVIF